eukprot:163911-Pyramimonas_sp.AAC.1
MDIVSAPAEQIRQLEIALTRKRKGGGGRCIAFSRAFSRLHGKLHARAGRDWERERGLGKQYSASQGRGPEDTV